MIFRFLRVLRFFLHFFAIRRGKLLLLSAVDKPIFYVILPILTVAYVHEH